MQRAALIKQIKEDESYLLGNKRKYCNMNYYHVVERQKMNMLNLLLEEIKEKEKNNE